MPSIAFVVPEMLPVPPVQGGAVEGWVHEVSCGLALRGFEVAVVSRPADSPYPARPGADAVRRLGVPWSRAGRRWYERRRAWDARHPLRPLVKIANVLEYAAGVRRALRELDPDIVYVHNDPYLAALLGRRAGRARVLHMHNDHLVGPALARPLLARVIAGCDRVLFVSDFLRDRARAAYPHQAARLQTVLNAVDIERADAAVLALPGAADGAAAAADAPCWLYAGRLVPQKGVHVLLAAFAQVRRQLPQARLTIAGSSFFADAPSTPYERLLRRQAEPLREAVRFTGFVPHARLAALYREVDAVVVPSTWDDPCPLVVLEAMASGACVIASQVGGIPELVHDGQTGCLVPAGDVDALSSAMLRVVQEHGLRQRLGEAARREAVQRFDLPRLVEEISTCFKGLAPPAAPRAAAAAGAVLRSREP